MLKSHVNQKNHWKFDCGSPEQSLDEFLFVFRGEYVDGYGACAGGWRTAAIGQLGRIGHAGADGWFRAYTIGTCAPAKG